MKSKIITILFATAALALAQGGRGPQNTPNRAGMGAGLDMTKVQTIEGTVSAINMAYGAQYPSIQVNQTTVKIAPVWFLLESDFEIRAGDKLKVTAAPSLQNTNVYLTAITITNTVSSASITLRDSNGVPLWSQSGNGSGQGSQNGNGTCIGCGGFTSVTTVAGTVEQVAAGIGIQMPTLVLKTSDGKVLTLKIGPERILEASDFEIKAGDKLTVKYGVTCTDELAALELTNATGVTLVLRNADGAPAWR